MGVAFLDNYDEYTTFEYDDRTISFLTGKRLKRYLRVIEWDDGYLVVECENIDTTIEEDYIDLKPILKNLYMKPEDFLSGIKEVRIKNAS